MTVSKNGTVQIEWSYPGDRKPVYWFIDGVWVHKGWLMPEATAIAAAA